MEGIKIIFEKLSSYNIFNYLLPGILFVIITKEICGHNLIQENDFIGGFLYYFIGMIISRVGSVIIEPSLKGIKFIKFEEYKLFVQASKVDGKIELLSEINNTYRTIFTMMLLVCCEFLYVYLKSKYNITHETTMMFIYSFIAILFLLSYRKQTNYITKRINANNNS